MNGHFIPQYRLIYDDICAEISSGALSAGNRLPCERELCEKYKVQRITVRKALEMLVADGLIDKRPGIGSFVSGAHCDMLQEGTILFIMRKSKNDIRSNSSAFNARLFFIMEQMCRETGYTLLYTGISNDKELDVLNEVYPVKGAFLTSTVDSTTIGKLSELKIPALCINHVDKRLLSILPDNEGGIRELVAHLVQQGHKHIAYIGGVKGAVNAFERHRGFVSALEENNLPRLKGFELEGDWTYDSAVLATNTLLDYDEKPTAIVAASDMMAVGVIQAAISRGLSLPSDLSVVGFDNIDLCRLCQPQLTSIGPSVDQMANIAVHRLVDMIQRVNDEDFHYIIRVPNAFGFRDSVMHSQDC